MWQVIQWELNHQDASEVRKKTVSYVLYPTNVKRKPKKI